MNMLENIMHGLSWAAVRGALHDVQPLLPLITLLFGALLISVLWALVRVEHRLQKQRGVASNAAHTEHAALAKEIFGVNARLAQLEQQLANLTARHDQLELREAISRTYEPAITLVHKGADVEELIKTCGLARGEAELIMTLYHGRPAANAAQH